MKHTPITAALLLVSLGPWLLFHCTSPFTPSSVLTGFRTLAVRADPPEVAPGATTRLDALIYEPSARSASPATVEMRWLACDPPLADQALTPCDDASFIQRLESVTDLSGFNELPVGMTSLGTSTSARYSFTGTTSAGRAVTAVVLLAARTGRETEISRKEIIISHRTERNHNPEIEFVLVGRERIDAEELVDGRAGRKLAWSAIVTDASPETYLLVRPDGTEALKTEDLNIEWFATDGRFGVDYEPPSGRPIIDRFVDAGEMQPDVGPREGGGESSKDDRGRKVTLNLPLADDEETLHIRVIVVVRDGRGGITWTERGISLRP